MQSKNTRLEQLGPICYTNDVKKTHLRYPNPALFSNISTLWEILELIVQDWYREASPYQENINNSKTENEELYFVAKALNELSNARFLKCIFSYVFFFVALERAYERFYGGLDKLNVEPFFRVTHDKKPAENSYIKKVRQVRNISIAHIDSDKANDIDAQAGMIWSPLMLSTKLGGKTNLDELTFQAGQFISRDASGNIIAQSSDLSIKGIPELHRECADYLRKYDLVCSSYLETLMTKLPLIVGDGRYEILHKLWEMNKDKVAPDVA